MVDRGVWDQKKFAGPKRDGEVNGVYARWRSSGARLTDGRSVHKVYASDGVARAGREGGEPSILRCHAGRQVGGLGVEAPDGISRPALRHVPAGPSGERQPPARRRVMVPLPVESRIRAPPRPMVPETRWLDMRPCTCMGKSVLKPPLPVV